MRLPERISLAIDAPASRSQRQAVVLNAFATRIDGSTFLLTISDLAFAGCGGVSRAHLRAEEWRRPAIPGRGTPAALMRWYAEGRAGLSFGEEATDVGARVP